MDPAQASGVRALAAWLQARRELTERVEVLLMHGPTAVARVQKHLDELKAGYDRELAAFAAFAGPRAEPQGSDTPPGAGRVMELPRPTATRDDDPGPPDPAPSDGVAAPREAPASRLRSISLPP